jgi:hypothetical protein
MTPATITAVCTGAAGIITALAALVRSFRTSASLTAHINDPKAHQ